MALTHNLGFPRIGTHRELKFALENYWQGKTDAATLHSEAQALRQQNWQHQAACDWLPVGDFSLYDHVAFYWATSRRAWPTTRPANSTTIFASRVAAQRMTATHTAYMLAR